MEDDLQRTTLDFERNAALASLAEPVDLPKKEKTIKRRHTPQLATNMTQNSNRETFNLRTVEAAGLSTFVSLRRPDEILFIKNGTKFT